MASKFTVQITKVATGGPYAYVILQDGVGLKAADAQANISTALDNVKADIAAAVPGGETIQRVGMDVTTS